MNNQSKFLVSLLLCSGFSASAFDYNRDPIDQVADAETHKTMKDFENHIFDLEEVQSSISHLAIYCPRGRAQAAELKEMFRPAFKKGDFYLLFGGNECTGDGLNYVSVKPVDSAKNTVALRLGHVPLSPLARYRTRAMYQHVDLEHEVNIQATCTHYTLHGLWDEDYFVCPFIVPGELPLSNEASGFISFKVSAVSGVQ